MSRTPRSGVRSVLLLSSHQHMFYLNVIDNDGKQHKFSMLSIDESLPEEPGILIVSSKPTPDHAGLIYVSCTDNISTALSPEAKKTFKDEHDADTVGVYIEHSASHCSATAKSIIERHAPACNV